MLRISELQTDVRIPKEYDATDHNKATDAGMDPL